VRTEARFPEVPPGRGHYESFYLKAAPPEGGRAIWIRHTFHRQPGAEATGAVWVTWFDRERARPVALKRQFPAAELSVPSGSYFRVDGAEIGPGRASGVAETVDSSARWDLSWTDHAEPLRHLPADWMYRTPLPRTKPLSPHPATTVDGEVEIDGEVTRLDGWNGMVGQNWGAEHAATWIWIHASGIGGVAGDYIDIAAGRVRIGPVLTPWVANGGLVLGGEMHRLGGLGAVRSTRIEAEPTSCRFVLPGEGIRIEGTVGAPAERFVGWLYADPGGGTHNSLNCSISDLAVTVDRGGDGERISVEGSAAYEHGTGDTSHGVPIEPYPDG
jgi:hypothetical protein